MMLLVAIGPLMLVMAFNSLSKQGYFNQTTDIFTKSIQDSLLTIVKSKAGALEDYIDSTKTIGQSMASTDAMQRYIAYQPVELALGEVDLSLELASSVENLLYSFQEAHWGRYHHIFLIDQTKRIVISPNHGIKEKGSPSSHLHEDTSSNRWVVNALLSGEVAVTDYSSWVESDHIHQMLFYPIKNVAGVTKAVVGFELQIPHEEKILTSNFELGETGRVFLATTEGVPILYKGMDNEPPLNTNGLAEAQATGFSSGVRENSSGVEVIDLYLKNEKYPWILVAEIETEEAFRNINQLKKIVLIGFSITLLIAIVLSLVFSNNIVNPIKKLTKQMEKVSLGQFNIKLDQIDRNDEIGSMLKAFDRIVVSLRIVMRRYQTLLKSQKEENLSNDLETNRSDKPE